MPRKPLKSSKIHLKGHRQGKERGAKNIKEVGQMISSFHINIF